MGGVREWVQTATATADSYDPAKNPGKAVPPPDSDQVRQAIRDLAAAKAQQAHAQQTVSSAQSVLDAAKRLAEQARGMREDVARRTVTELHEASDAGIHNRHWWEKAVHWIADQWDEIVTVCKWIVAILGIVVVIVGGPLAWLVVGGGGTRIHAR
jgi:methyl-accepting chemotaxis protein